MVITSRKVAYTADGLTMFGHLARPNDDAGPRPAVLFAHDGIGLNDYQRSYVDDLAERGFVAFAMEYHGGRWYSDYDELRARVLPLIADPERMCAIGRAGLDVLLAEPGVNPNHLAGVGLGAGGSILLELARDGVPFQAVAVVHPGFPAVNPGDWPGANCSFLLCTGSEDPLCTPNQVEAFSRILQEAGMAWQANIYGGAKHAFWHPPVRPDGTLAQKTDHGGDYDHAAHHPLHARRVWRDVTSLLSERQPAL